MKKLATSKKLKVKNLRQENDLSTALVKALNSHTTMLMDLSARVVCMEELFLEKNTELSPRELELRIARVLDKGEGLIAGKKVISGDKLRITAVESDAPPQRFVICNVGSGETLSKEQEDQFLGKRVGEQFTLSLENSEVLAMTIDTISTQKPTVGEEVGK